jgi:7-keto-8-aminopelargonate synthetase-like enzyme
VVGHACVRYGLKGRAARRHDSTHHDVRPGTRDRRGDKVTAPRIKPGTFTPTLGLEGTLTGFYGDPRTVTFGVDFKY